jgi:hypothetical protein
LSNSNGTADQSRRLTARTPTFQQPLLETWNPASKPHGDLGETDQLNPDAMSDIRAAGVRCRQLSTDR